MTAQEFAARLQQMSLKVRWQGSEYRAQCPYHAHEPGKPKDLNLSFRDGDHELLIQCHSHDCTYQQVIEAVEQATGKEPRQRKNGAAPHGEPNVVARYRYTDEKGELLYEVWRYHPKDFRPHTLQGTRWVPGLPRSVRHVLYRLPELLAANPKQPVFLCNGEKAVEALQKRGLVATCSQGGELVKWRNWPEYVETLKGRYCVILQDNDEAGERHTRELFEVLTEAGVRAKKLLLPSLPPGGDVVDWLEAGATPEELLEKARPEPHPLIVKLLSREALRNLPAPVWQIHELFYEQSIIEVYGESNHGKSLVGMDIALNMVRGNVDWAGRPILKPGPVIYVNADGGPGFSPRLKAWEKANGSDAFYEFWTYPMELLIADPRQMAEFTEGLSHLEFEPALMVIDTLSQCIPGVNENQQEEMSRVVAHLNAIKRRYGCTIMLLHHVGKDGLNRGSTVIPGAADTIIRVTQQPGELVELRCDKQRDGRKFLPFYFSIQSHDNDEGVYLVPAAGPIVDAREEREQQVLDVLRVNGGWLTREEVKARVNRMSAASVYRYLKALVASETVMEMERTNNSGHVEKVYLYKQPLER